MPYLFAFTLVLNIAALGYFIFANDGLTGNSPQVDQAQSSISKTVSITANDSMKSTETDQGSLLDPILNLIESE